MTVFFFFFSQIETPIFKPFIFSKTQTIPSVDESTRFPQLWREMLSKTSARIIVSAKTVIVALVSSGLEVSQKAVVVKAFIKMAFKIIIQENLYCWHSVTSEPDWRLPTHFWSLGTCYVCFLYFLMKLELFGNKDAALV